MNLTPDPIHELRRRLFISNCLIVLIGMMLAWQIYHSNVSRMTNEPELRARSFVLVNERNTEIARLSNTPDGPMLVMRSPQPGVTLLLGARSDEAGMDIVVNNEPVISLHSGRDNNSILSFADAQGNKRIILGVDPDPIMAFLGRQSEIQFSLSTDPNPNITISNERGEFRFPPPLSVDDTSKNKSDSTGSTSRKSPPTSSHGIDANNPDQN